MLAAVVITLCNQEDRRDFTRAVREARPRRYISGATEAVALTARDDDCFSRAVQMTSDEWQPQAVPGYSGPVSAPLRVALGWTNLWVHEDNLVRSTRQAVARS